MKKITLIALFLSAAIMLNTFCFALETNETVVEESNQVTMTLEEAVAFALKNNSTIKDTDFKTMVNDQKDLYNDEKITYQVWKNKMRSGGYSFETPTDYLASRGHMLEMAKLSYNSVLSAKGSAEETISYTIKQLAYTIDQLEKSLELIEKTIVKQERDVKIAEVKSSLNMITALDVETAKQTLTSTKLQLESLKPTLASVKNTLKNLMGFDLSKELVITLPETELTILEVSDLSKIIEDSLETNSDAIKAKIEFKTKEMNYILATNTHWFAREETKDAKKAYSDAELRLNNSIKFIKDNLYTLHNSVKTSEESAILAKSEYDQLQIKYKQMEVMHELGMITTHDFNSYEIALINAKNAYDKSLQENILLNERWNIALKYGDVLAKEEGK